MADEPKKLTIFDVQAKVAAGEKVFQVTATDFPTARLVDRAEIDFILIGDSLGMTALGYPSTVPVTMDEMIHHAKAISWAAGGCRERVGRRGPSSSATPTRSSGPAASQSYSRRSPTAWPH